jgi:phage tail sheath gpL-like
MAISNLPDQKTPARPVEITFAAETGTPSANQEVLCIGHANASMPASAAYVVSQVNNAGDRTAAQAELLAKYGDCELTDMVLAAIKANEVTGRFVSIKACPVKSTDLDFGPADEALTAIDRVKAEFVVSPYDGQDSALRDKLKDTVAAMSGPQRPANNQFGTFGVVANQDEADPSALDLFDTQYIIGVWKPDSAPVESLAELAAAAAAVMAGNNSPFNPLDDVTINGLDAPADQADWITVGFGLESESCLNQGWTPLRVKPNGEVAFVRTVTGRISADGSGTPVVTSYYDVQDFQVLYFWRKTVYTRLSQPDFKQRKASNEAATDIKSELVRLATLFQEQQMFQAVDQLAKKFVVERATSDRHRFNVLTPVNVIPGLHVIATNIEATTEFDTLSL